MTTTDDLVTDDLRALASLHGHPRAPALDVALRGHQPIVALEDTGALAARTAALAAEVRALRTISAHRVARLVTGVVALLTALGFAAFIADPASVYEPRFNVGGALIGLGFLYVVALGVAQARFDRRMTRPRAAREPSELVARLRAPIVRLDGWSTGLAMAGLTALVPAFGAILAGRSVWSYALATDVHLADAVFGHGNLLVFATLSLGAAGLVGARVHRSGPARPRWMRQLESATTIVTAGALAAVAIGMAVSATADVPTEVLSELGQLGRAALAQLATTLFAAWAVLRLRRLEQARLAGDV